MAAGEVKRMKSAASRQRAALSTSDIGDQTNTCILSEPFPPAQASRHNITMRAPAHNVLDLAR